MLTRVPRVLSNHSQAVTRKPRSNAPNTSRIIFGIVENHTPTNYNSHSLCRGAADFLRRRLFDAKHRPSLQLTSISFAYAAADLLHNKHWWDLHSRSSSFLAHEMAILFWAYYVPVWLASVHLNSLESRLCMIFSPWDHSYLHHTIRGAFSAAKKPTSGAKHTGMFEESLRGHWHSCQRTCLVTISSIRQISSALSLGFLSQLWSAIVSAGRN